MIKLFQKFWDSSWRNPVLYLAGSLIFVAGILVAWARARSIADATIGIALLVFVAAAVVVGFLVAVFKRERPDQKNRNSDLQQTAYFLFGLATFGCVVVVAWGSMRTPALTAIAQALLLLGGAGLVGGVLGLLFGIPKSVSDPATVVVQPPAGGSAGNASGVAAANAMRGSYAVNTNLEQISDWLTKIIVGVGLTQLPTLREEFGKIAEYYGQGFASSAVCVSACAQEAAPAIAAAILIYGLAAGFLAGYLLTRIFLPGVFNRADQESRKIEQAKSEATAQFGRDITEISKDLYSYDAAGFRNAISKLDKLLESDEAKRNPALWAYLAAAHGQAWKWENEKRSATDPDKSAILKKHRDAALEAVREATKLSSDWKPILYTMWDADNKDKAEDDLEVFYKDPDFAKELKP